MIDLTLGARAAAGATIGQLRFHDPYPQTLREVCFLCAALEQILDVFLHFAFRTRTPLRPSFFYLLGFRPD